MAKFVSREAKFIFPSGPLPLFTFLPTFLTHFPGDCSVLWEADVETEKECQGEEKEKGGEHEQGEARLCGPDEAQQRGLPWSKDHPLGGYHIGWK